MKALRDMNLPKFVFEDVPLFLGLIGDLFPGLDCPHVRYRKFNDAVEAVLMDNKYILLPHQVKGDVCVSVCRCVGVWVCVLSCHSSVLNYDGDCDERVRHVQLQIHLICCPAFPPQSDKVVQRYETMLRHHTTMVVGPTGGGKSVVINTLAQAQTR